MQVDGWFNFDKSKVIWQLNGCLETTISRAEVVETNDYPQLLADRLAPLVFLSMPVHDQAEQAKRAERPPPDRLTRRGLL